MARKRMIDPGVWGDEGFIELNNFGKIMFLGLISHADDMGKGIGSSKSLKANIFPAEDISIKEIDSVKAEIQKHTRTRFYKVNGKEYYKLEKWKSYQYVNHPQESAIPEPLSKEHDVNNTVTLHEHDGNDTVTLRNDSLQIDRKIDKEIDKAPSADADASLTAFKLLEKINEWIEKIDEGYQYINKPNNGSKEWKFLQRMAKEIRTTDLVFDVLNRLHHKDKLRRGIITSWMPEEIKTCLEEISKEAIWQ